MLWLIELNDILFRVSWPGCRGQSTNTDMTSMKHQMGQRRFGKLACFLWIGMLSSVSFGGELALREIIDREIKATWISEKITPPEQCSDSVFVRRVYLDLVGIIPGYKETVGFLQDSDPKKREKLVDKLLADPRYSRNQAQIWDLNLLGRNPKHVGHQDNRKYFRRWLETQFTNNEPYDRLVHKLLKAEEDGPQLYYVVNRGSNELTTTTMRLFLGTQLQCAKCHDHPFEDWTQRDYYGMAGFFVRTFVHEGEKKENVTRWFVGEKSTGHVNFTIVPKDAKPGTKGESVAPKFLGGSELEEPELPVDFKEPKVEKRKAPPKPQFSRREKIVEWITSADNPYLARAAVNRIWAQFMGRGLVHPVDDLNKDDQGSHPLLFKEIEKQIVEHNFDVKWLVREIVNSKAYQVADVGTATHAAPKFYERARVRPLSVEELYASLHLATGLDVEIAAKGRPSGDMLKYLGEPFDGRGNFQGSATERLFVHNGDVFRNLCHPRNDNLSERLLKGSESPEAKVDRMFLSVLSRTPTDEERARFMGYLKVEGDNAKQTSERMEEAMWVLVSCSEFRFNR